MALDTMTPDTERAAKNARLLPPAEPRPEPRERGGPWAGRVLASDRFGLAVFAGVVLASFALVPLTMDFAYLWLGTALVAVICGLAVVARRLGADPLIILGGQLLVLAGFVYAMASVAGNPDLESFARIPDLYGQGIQHMATQPTPMEPSAGVTLLFVTGIGVIAIMTDHLVETVQRPLWSLAPLLTLYLITALVPNLTAPWWAFVAVFAGWIGILLAEGMNRAEAWTRGISANSVAKSSVGPIAWQLGAMIAIPALVIALLAAMAIPVRDASGTWSLAPPSGAGGPLQLSNPAQDLKRNLTQPEDRVVMTYQTTAERPPYLRMATLPKLDGRGFSGVPIQLQNGTDLPPPPGLMRAGDASIETTMQIGELNSQYLPLPYPTDRFEAPGQWAYDPDSLMVLATGPNSDTATANLQYRMWSYPAEPDGRALSTAETGRPSDYGVTGEIPADLPNGIFDLTRRVVGNIQQPALKAAKIQEYLREEYDYSLDPEDSTGFAALETFLLDEENGKKGFCVQFAASMAVMARIEGIPSRMAIGFLPGTKVGDTYEVTIKNMHAWPELYFEDFGWVRFEPTPSVATAPPWTRVGSDTGDDTAPSDEASEVPVPSGAPTTSASPVPVPQEQDRSVRNQDLWALVGRFGIAAGVVALLGLLAAIPALVRHRRRRIRLAADGPPAERVENAWGEVHDLVLDHGYDWPASTPRDTGTVVAAKLSDTPARAMQRLSVLVERARFARDYRSQDDPRSLVQHVEQGLQAREEGRLGRLSAKLWPRSVWHGRFGRR